MQNYRSAPYVYKRMDLLGRTEQTTALTDEVSPKLKMSEIWNNAILKNDEWTNQRTNELNVNVTHVLHTLLPRKIVQYNKLSRENVKICLIWYLLYEFVMRRSCYVMLYT